MTVLKRRLASVQVGPVVADGLRCVFRVERTMRRNPNQVDVKVYNLNETSRAAIELSRATNATGATDGLGHPVRRVFVSLTCGYEGQTFRTFHGDVRRIIHTVESPDIVTQVLGGDGEVASFTSRVSRAFVPGSTVQAVVTYLAQVMGVGIGNAVQAFRGAHLRDLRNYRDGTVLSGSAATEMDLLCAAAGLEWSIQDDTLQIVQLGQAIGDSGVELSPDTGLIGSPSKDPVTRVVRAKCFIMPNIVPGRRVLIRSHFITQVIRINKATIVGDTHGPDWYIDLEGRAPRPPLAINAPR